MTEPRAPQRPLMAPLRPYAGRLVNPITRPVAGRLPGFGILVYHGRKSGRLYRTPMNVFRDGRDWIIALTYGSDVQWLKNIEAEGGCELISRGRSYDLENPRLFVDPARRLMPIGIRQMLWLLRVSEFVRMSSREPVA